MGAKKHCLPYGFFYSGKTRWGPPRMASGKKVESASVLGGLPPAATGSLPGEGPGETNIESGRKSDEMGRT